MRSGFARQADTARLRARDILAKCDAGESLDLPDVEHLLKQENPCLRETVALAAGHLKERHFGRRIALFAPLYLSNECANNCLYCGFRRDRRPVEEVCAALGARSLIPVFQQAERQGGISFDAVRVRTCALAKAGPVARD